MKRLLFAAALAAASPASAHDVRKGEIVVDHPLMRASLGRAPNTAAYAVLRNAGSAPDRLIGASCACARKVEIHHHDMSGGVMKMHPMTAVTVPAKGALTLAPGEGHALMLMGLKKPVEAGTMVEVRLRFERAGEVRVPFYATRDVERELNSHGRGAAAVHAH